MQVLIVIAVIILAIIVLPYILGAALVVAGIYLIYRLTRLVLKNRYFNSPEFLAHKDEIEATIAEYNEISEYVKSIPNNNQFIAKTSGTDYSHLANFENTSKQNYVRDRNQSHAQSRQVYSTSLQVVRKASEEPIKYLCKYFNIKPTEENLEQLEEIGNNVSKIENTVANLDNRQKEIETNFNPPKFIVKHYYSELMDKIGMDLPEIKIKYARYVFEYVSAGGNSSQKTTVTLNGPTIEAISEYISQKIKFSKTVAGQRALMTNKLRNFIKERDHYTCQNCSASVADQSLLLLEVDHITPVSKGGLTTVDNLQTLCWKCNRSKSNKIS
jgi:hypothetical protein